MSQGQIVAAPEEGQCLDGAQLAQLEQAFRRWAGEAHRADLRHSRRRILLIFLLIRYTGAKLNEVLALDPFAALDCQRQTLLFAGPDGEQGGREIQIATSLCREIEAALRDPEFRDSLANLFEIDPAFVRRKFYERARECGFAQRLAGPEMIRRARAVELMQGDLPLPAVQRLLGHSTPNQTSAYVSFSEEEVREMTRLFMEREATRKTSARNAFFGRIETIRRGDIQSLVALTTPGGYRISTVITNDSLEALGLREGMPAAAEVKAPWVILHKGEEEPGCSAENRCQGIISRTIAGRVNNEYVVLLGDGTELCAIVTAESGRRLALAEGDPVWAMFNGFSVILHVG